MQQILSKWSVRTVILVAILIAEGISRKSIKWIFLFHSIFFVSSLPKLWEEKLSLFATSLPASVLFMKTESAYDLVFKQSARISLASLLAFVIADLMDVLIFVRIRKALGTKALWFRNNISNFISQFFDTVLFISLAFYEPNLSIANNGAFLLSLIIPYWFLKCSMSTIEIPFVYLAVTWLKKAL